MKCKALAFGAALIVSVAAQAEILAGDGFAVGGSDYIVGELAGQSPAATGFVGIWEGYNGKQCQVLGADDGLLPPAGLFTGPLAATGGCVTYNPATNDKNPRSTTRAFTPGLLARTEGEVYFRLLCNIDALAASQLTNTAVGASVECFQGAGLVATNSLAGVSSLHMLDDRTGLVVSESFWFGYSRDSLKRLNLSLFVRGVGERSARQYILVANAETDRTYLCLARIAVGAGSGGREKVSALAVPTDEYRPQIVYTLVDREHELIGDVFPTTLAVNGEYGLNGGKCRFDEFRVATALADVVAVEPVSGYSRRFDITVDYVPDPSAEGLENFPVPVMLEASDNGFRYENVLSEGRDLVFTSADGATVYPHEIEDWNSEGVSHLWVRVPRLEAGMTIRCNYGRANESEPYWCSNGSVWSGYAAVCHFNASSANVESSVNRLPFGYAANGGRASDAGIFGGGLRNGQANLFSPLRYLGSVSDFTVSGWFKAADKTTQRFISNKSSYDKDGFELLVDGNNVLFGRASSNTPALSLAAYTTPPAWTQVAGIYAGSSVKLVCDGEVRDSGDDLKPVKHGNAYVGIGGWYATAIDKYDNTGNLLKGDADEVRFYDGVATAARLEAEYALMTHAELLSFGPVSVNAVDYALKIVSVPSGLGSPDPACGEYATAAEGLRVTSGAPVFTDGTCFVADSYTVQRFVDGDWTAPQTFSGTEYVCGGGAPTLLTWNWRQAATRVDCGFLNESGSIGYSVPADYTNTVDGVDELYFNVGRELTVTATANALGAVFHQWVDPSNVASFGNTFTVGELPVVRKAVWKRAWTYDASSKVLSDGSWAFTNTTVNAGTTELEIKGRPKTWSPTGVLDFTTGIFDASGNGNEYLVVGFSGSNFANNLTLREVYVQEGFRHLRWYAFQGCTSLTTFSPLLPDSAVSGGAGRPSDGSAFDGCISLTGDVRCVNADYTYCGWAMFRSTKVTSSCMPNLTTSGNGLFQSCSALTNAVIGSAIGGGDFRDCGHLKHVLIIGTIRAVAAEAFRSCVELESFEPFLPGSVTNVGNHAFAECRVLSGDLSITNALAAKCGSNAFSSCPGLRSVRWPALETLEGGSNFAKWNGAESVCTNFTFGRASVKLTGSCFAAAGAKGCRFYFPYAAPTIGSGATAVFGWDNYRYALFACPQLDPEGWEAFKTAANFAELTDAERARSDFPVLGEGERCRGTLGFPNEKTPPTLYKVWFVTYKSEFYKSGLMVYVR